MRLLSHLNTEEYPFYIPQNFYHAFSTETVSLNFDPFSLKMEKDFVPLRGMKSKICYSLNKPLAQTFILKSYHSNVVASVSESIPNADAQYIVAPFSHLSSVFQGKRHIGIQTADCLAVVFCFENKEYFIGAISHAGWRGYANGILQNTLETLKQEALLVGVSSAELLTSLKIHIAPAIFGVSYESGIESQEALLRHGEKLFSGHPKLVRFLKLYQELIDVRHDKTLRGVVDKILLQNQKSHFLPGKIFPDLQLLAALECFLSGVQLENIEILRENTYNHPALYSFREASHKKSDCSLRQWTHLVLPCSAS